ncbi:hypothetical protein [Candidatus Nitrosocosmicus sp. SS]|jgi:hypothetical protein|uniref:hypothetical protein n=1 Tax=Candidatus Nitrosocosmicus agrestis TaxID=2563600 RepID=UPI00122E7893|nr:hypothetical protein [Candidatus Nitrosocosmicus sp. SS]KAA2283557.1 hypothetical protein F1Z66_01380 [Candidatus Nitrosocosmicus sp. SS]KAF0869638.1 hypothetical protein E5N71_03910 [Candidatus Nitrosocosmicus sp. SS]
MFSFKTEQDGSDMSVRMRNNITDYVNFMFPEKSFKEREKPILYLIKSCENYDLNERESIESINKVLGDKSISRRTYYNYKKKLYDSQTFDLIKNSCYNTIGVKLFILDGILDDGEQTMKADKLIGQQFPKRKQVLEDEEKQKEELDSVMERARSDINRFQEMETRQAYLESTFSSNHTIREEFVKCGKEFCLQCPHGPYYYAYWKDSTTKKLKKKYLGVIDPRQ